MLIEQNVDFININEKTFKFYLVLNDSNWFVLIFKVSVRWEVINEDDKINKGTVVKMEATAPKKVAEQDIFGGAVSDSEEEDAQLNVLDVMDENTQNSAEDSHLTDFNSVMVCF